MLAKILGGALLVIGVLLAARMLFGVIWALLGVVLTVAIVIGLIWGGWRLLNQS